MYPDWRFRPGANALAKLKIKDGGTTLRRRSARVKEPPDGAADTELVDADQGGRAKEKGGKGRNRSKPGISSLEEMRCAKIADLVADGIQGVELEVAVKQWEGDRKAGKEKSQRPRLSRNRGASSASAHAWSHSSAIGSSSSMFDSQYPNRPSPDSTSNPPQQNSQLLIVDGVEQVALDNHSPLSSGLPLTHMFKRSLSAPALHTDLPAGPISPSEPSDDSSVGDTSPYTTTEPRSGSWDNYNSPLIMQMSPTGTHSHAHERRDSIYPMPSGTTNTRFDAPQPQPHLTWQGAENQRRMEEMQEPNPWWGDSRSTKVEPSSSFGYNRPTESGQPASGITDMGYKSCAGTHFDGGYVEV